MLQIFGGTLLGRQVEQQVLLAVVAEQVHCYQIDVSPLNSLQPRQDHIHKKSQGPGEVRAGFLSPDLELPDQL